jgi:hypothetical protein
VGKWEKILNIYHAKGNKDVIMKKKKIELSIKIIIEYILSLLIVLDCNSVFMHTNNSSNNIMKIIAAMIIIILILIDLKISKSALVRFFIIFGILIIYLGIFTIINVTSDRFLSFESRFLIVFPLTILLLLLYSSTKNEFRLFYCISNIVTIMAIISLVFWMGCSVLKIINLNSSLYINWGGGHYIRGFYNLYYETQPIDFFGYYGYRNTSIFTEAPMFSLCLSIALLTEFFLRKKLNLKKIMVLYLTIITTFSTTGYIVLVMCTGAQVLKSRNSNKKYMKVIKIFFIILTICIGAIIVYYLAIDKMTTDSYSVRIDKYITEFNIWKKNILVGNGYGNNEEGSSNSLMVILADGGLWLFSLYIIPIIEFVAYRKNNNLFYFGIIFLWLIIVTIFPYSLIMYVVLALGYKMIISREYKKNDKESI